MRSINQKHKTLLAGGVRPAASGGCNVHYKNRWYQVTPRGAFVLQTTPEHHIDKILDCGVSNTQLYKIAGNGWTDEVIAHILRFIKGE